MARLNGEAGESPALSRNCKQLHLLQTNGIASQVARLEQVSTLVERG